MLYLNTIVLILLSVVSTTIAHKPKYALCVVPVAEALGAPTPRAYRSSYFALPCMFYKDAQWPYGRKHQLIFQEVVEVLQEQDEQLLITLPGVFYETKLISKPDTTAWVHASSMRMINPAELGNLPTLLSCNRSDFLNALEGTGALTAPYYEPSLHITLSAGTRFVIESATESSFAVWCYDPATSAMRTISIPHTHFAPYEKQSSAAQRKQFVTLVQSWADQTNGPIAYVLGGNSVVTRHPNQQPGTVTFFKQRGFNWPHNEQPATGLDCSGLIVRACHIVGIPLFYKNSITMARYLRETTNPEPGDILWIPGHVMILSDIEQGLLVEARGYPTGYGIVHEIPLKEQFAGITSVATLVECLKSKEPLHRINKRGELVEVCPDFKILSLIS
jgi:hypothetical protein